MWKIVLAVAVVVIIAGIVLVSAANAAGPGDFLYGLDRGMESIRLALTNDPQSVKQLQKQYTLERREEIRVLAERGDTAQVEQAVQELNQEMENAAQQNKDQDKPDKNEKVNGPKDKDKEKDKDKPEDDEPKEPKDGAYCDGSAEKNHPSGDKLAEQYGVSYAEVMGWFCQGYGFGEVDLAYSISQEAGVPVSEIFALRAGGMGWGDILQKYGLTGKPDKNKDKGKPEEKEKDKKP